MMTADPTRDEMLAHLASLPFADEYDELDKEAAIYWFAADYHGGQWTQLYAALCASPYKPGPIETGPDYDGMEGYLYRELVARFTTED